MNNLVAITQPDFFPWLGSIEKIKLCNTFIFLNHVTNRPNDGIWTKRVKILINGKPQWLIVPLKRDPLREFIPINEMLIDYDSKFMGKHLSTIIQNYSKAPFFDEVYPLFEKTYNERFELIEQFNRYFILSLCARMGIERKIFFSSEMNVPGKSNELLLNLVMEVKGDAYLYGSGSLGYLDPAIWKAAGIDLVPQDFVHPHYEQFNQDQLSDGLSILDALMNLGFVMTERLLRSSI